MVQDLTTSYVSGGICEARKMFPDLSDKQLTSKIEASHIRRWGVSSRRNLLVDQRPKGPPVNPVSSFKAVKPEVVISLDPGDVEYTRKRLEFVVSELAVALNRPTSSVKATIRALAQRDFSPSTLNGMASASDRAYGEVEWRAESEATKKQAKARQMTGLRRSGY
jgi:hypothetical protein